jgi:hypothetical protein
MATMEATGKIKTGKKKALGRTRAGNGQAGKLVITFIITFFGYIKQMGVNHGIRF